MVVNNNQSVKVKDLNQQIVHLDEFIYVRLFRLNGLIVNSFNYHLKYYGVLPKLNKNNSFGSFKLSYFYCRLIYILFWFITLRQFALNFIDNREIEKYLGDFSYYWTLNRTSTEHKNYRIYYLVPTCLLSVYNICLYTLFINNEKRLNWIQPFLSILRLRTTKLPDINDYTPYRIRIYINLSFTFLITIVSTFFICQLSYDTSKIIDENFFILWLFWLILEIILSIYFIFANYLIITYFNLVCAVLTYNFRILNKEFTRIGDERRKFTFTINELTPVKEAYHEHFRLSGIVEDSNSFWCVYVFVTFFTLIPCSCYIIYNLFFGDLNEKLVFFYRSILAHVAIILLFICLSSVSVHEQAHECFVDLAIISNSRITPYMRMNLKFLCQRLTQDTLGFKCFKFFNLTTFSLSAFSATVASYFLIISDFTRSVPAARYYHRNL